VVAEKMSSRERMLAAFACREPDYVPCCFSAFSALRARCRDLDEFVQRQLDMGLDVAVPLPELPVRHAPEVQIREWVERDPSQRYPVLHKEYMTPAGPLRTSVLWSEDWPHGEHVPFFDDYLIPRSIKPLITADDSLDALRYLLAPPTDEDVERMRTQHAEARRIAREHDLATACYYGQVGDVACWLAGMQQLMLMAVDEPEFVHRFLSIIEEWNARRVGLMLEQGPDLLVRRAWYENADLWSPAMFAEFLLPGLRRDADQVHAAGARFGYLMSCSSMPLVDMMIDAGVDVLLGVDPAQDRMMDFARLKAKAGGKMCLWGGVCGYLTVECGTPEQIRSQVREAISALAPGGGFILAPVTNIRADTPRAWRNVEALIDEWRLRRGGPRGS